MKDKIIDGDELLTTEGCTELIFDGIYVEKSEGKSDGFPFGTSNGETIGLYDITMLGVISSSKLGEKLL